MKTYNTTSAIAIEGTFHGKGGDANVAVKIYCEPTRSYYKLEWNGFSLATFTGNAKGLAAAYDEFDKVMARSV